MEYWLKRNLFFLMIIFASPCTAQQRLTDSLLQRLKVEKEDTTKVKTLINLSVAYKGESKLANKYIEESFA